MNDIPAKQNEERQIQRLGAQRQLYTSAKTIFAVQLALGGPIAVASAFLAPGFPLAKGYIALWGLLVVTSDVLWLTLWLKRLRNQGATVQEIFDCAMSWSCHGTISRLAALLIRS